MKVENYRFIAHIYYRIALSSKNCFWLRPAFLKSQLERDSIRMEKTDAKKIKTIPMEQETKQSRIVAWTFLTGKEQQTSGKLTDGQRWINPYTKPINSLYRPPLKMDVVFSLIGNYILNKIAKFVRWCTPEYTLQKITSTNRTSDRLHSYVITEFYTYENQLKLYILKSDNRDYLFEGFVANVSLKKQYASIDLGWYGNIADNRRWILRFQMIYFVFKIRNWGNPFNVIHSKSVVEVKDIWLKYWILYEREHRMEEELVIDSLNGFDFSKWIFFWN